MGGLGSRLAFDFKALEGFSAWAFTLFGIKKFF
jgi:hypothetical protein